MSHTCRVCKQPLTLDNIYPSDLKHRNWICKTCSNAKKQERNDRKKVVTIPPPQYDPADVAFKRGGVSNHIVKPYEGANHCQMCQAYDNGLCHMNPPPWPRVFKDDWCLGFRPIT